MRDAQKERALEMCLRLPSSLQVILISACILGNYLKQGKKLLEGEDRTIHKTITRSGRVPNFLDSMEKPCSAWVIRESTQKATWL